MRGEDHSTEDGLLGGQVRVLQPTEGYRVAIDSVFLAAAVVVRGDDRVLDMGCGTGAAALCLAARCPGVRVLGVEVQPEYAALARRSVDLNDMADRVTVMDGDLMCPGIVPDDWLPVDAVMANPPFFIHGNRASDAGRATAHHAEAGRLADWVAMAEGCLKPKGGLTLILPADRVGDALAALSSAFGAVEVVPLWPKPGREAKRVIVRAAKGRKTPLRLLPGLVLHEPDGAFTVVAQRILRDAVALAEVKEEKTC
ncbi:MAG: methyltransferase [Rhodospirillaceae bacterium]|nr:methyltransferase [Rhodospirillaceae bacterium]